MVTAAGGVAVGAAAMSDGDIVEDDYACVKDTPQPSGTDTTSPAEGAVGGNDDADNDSSYAMVNDFQAAGNGNHPYATVKDKKDKEHGYARVKDTKVQDKEKEHGYARVKDTKIQDQDKEHGYARVKDTKGKEKDKEHSYARVRDVHGASSQPGPQGAEGGGDQEEEEVPPVPHKPLDLDSPDHPSSPIAQRAGTASSPGSPDTSRGGPVPGPNGPDGDGPGWGQGPDIIPVGGPGRREPPYTQVSARESLESIRARQQHEHTQKTEEVLAASGGAGMATGGTAAPPGGDEPDFDGIYEQVDDNSVMGQNNTSPPPLPRGRQTFHAMGMVGRRVYEEITEDNRPRPPLGTNYNEDPEPYAVVDKTMTEHRSLAAASSNSNGNHGNHVVEGKATGPETEDFDQLYARVNKSGSGKEQGPKKPPQHQANNNNHKSRVNGDMGGAGKAGVSGGSKPGREEDKDFGALYAQVNKKNRKTIAIMETRSPRTAGSCGVAATNFNANSPSVNGAISLQGSGMQGQAQASALNSYSDIYADVDEAPQPPHLTGTAASRALGMELQVNTYENNYQSIDDDEDMAPRSPVDERLVHISAHRPSPALWVRREHTYQAVDDDSTAPKKQKKGGRSGKNTASGNKEIRERVDHNYETMRPTEPPGHPPEGSRVRSTGAAEGKVKPYPPTRRLSQEERAAAPNLVKARQGKAL